jgi:glycosyltransferase involved in cell wall biosynthesis
MNDRNDILVDILLSSHNGEKYIAAQIDSLLEQTHRNWHLLIRDDRSNDKTMEIIKKYIAKYPKQIFYCKIKEDQNLGVTQSFALLLSYAKANYILFCDQDDIWLPNKIEITLKKMLSLENHFKLSTPILVHTDLKVTDEFLNIKAASFWKSQNINPETDLTLKRLLLQNSVTGSTIMINAALKETVPFVPKKALMHDWWLALVAATFGKISYINTPTVLYRQHSQNVIGVSEWNLPTLFKKIKKIGNAKKELLRKQKQIAAFLWCYKRSLDKDISDMLDHYANLADYNFFKRKFFIIKYAYYMKGFFKNLIIFLFC